MVLKGVELIQGNYIAEIYRTTDFSGGPMCYALYNPEALNYENETCVQLLWNKPKKFKPLNEINGVKHFDLDWLDDYGNYDEVTGSQADRLIQTIKEEYEDEQKG